MALGLLAALPTLSAQAEELPPIFVPRPRVTENEVPLSRRTAAGAGVSDRMRTQMTARILEGVKAFEPPEVVSGAVARTTFTAEGALLMQRFVVKSIAPRRDEVEPPEALLRRFAPLERARRGVTGYSATLFQFLDGRGSVNFNVVKGAGQGVDHGRDFTRAELEFSLRW
ncbi:MAG: hypothetical protein EXS37_09840 [Opitutus sp.]|nr:hypothetical protein [Opitutus sp.]